MVWIQGRTTSPGSIYARATLSLHRIGPDESLDAGRDGAVVCVLHDAREGPVQADDLAVIVAHTPAESPIVVLGLSVEDEATLSSSVAARLRAYPMLPEATLRGLVDSVARAAAADLVLLTSNCRPPVGWLRRLRDAATESDAVGTASPLSPAQLGSDPSGGGTVEARDTVIVATAVPIRPRLQVGGPHCLYLRRTAVQLVGVPSPATESPRALIEGWSAEMVAAGLVNVLADDLFVGGGLDQPRTTPNDPLGALRELDRCDESSPLRRAVALARTAERGLTVTIDGRSLNQVGGGTQRYTLELILALHRFTDVSLRVVLPPDPASAANAALAQRPEIEVISYEQAAAGVSRSDVVHRPQQVFSEADLTLLRLLGDRLVVTHQDLIAYHNPTYHSSPDDWQRYRRITRLALTVADRTVFFSEAAADDARAEELVAESRWDVVGIALDAPFSDAPQRPTELAGAADFVLCLGADYRHKNRPFAIRVADALRADHDWAGRLVLAGAHVEHGSSEVEERALLEGNPALGSMVVNLGGVTDEQRSWLLQNARAVIVPSVAEGFGLVPLEAAAAGVPSLFAAQSSLREVVPESLASLVAWDAAASAARVIELLADGEARREHVRRLREAADRWMWEPLAGLLEASYRQAVRAPFRAAASRAWQELERERMIAEFANAYQQLDRLHLDLVAHLGDRAALARDDGFFTAAQQRGLLRVGSRPALARAVMWPFGLVGDLGPR
jgi:glycosyltransferase involved in cell wall biosynthesis